VPPIPLFVSGSGILAAFALGFAATLWTLRRQPGAAEHLKTWQSVWATLSVYAVFAAISLLAVNTPALKVWRQPASLISLGAALVHLMLLVRGAHALGAAGRPRPRFLDLGIIAIMTIAAVGVLLPAPADPELALARYLRRASLLAVGWSSIYLWAGWRIASGAREISPLGRNTLSGALVAYGLLRLVEPASHYVGPNPIIEQLLTLGGIPMQVAMGAGVLIALLDVEGARSVAALEARAAAQLAAFESEAELRRRDARFRSLIEHSTDIIFMLDRKGTVLYTSPSVTRVLGWSNEEVAGTSCFQYVHPEDVANMRDQMERSFARDPSLASGVPVRTRHRNGDYLRLEGASRPFVEEDGSPRLIVSLRDVRERDRMATELVAARRLESVGRLAGGIAHDFNNLLTAILGNVTLLRPLIDAGEEARTHLDEIDHAGRRGADLTLRLLAFARRQMIEPRTIDLGAQVHGLERLLRRLLGEDISLQIETPAVVWSVRADPTAIEQALINLVVNARDAMPRGGRLSVRVRHHAAGDRGLPRGIPAGEWVGVDVEDTGVGIDEHTKTRLFEPFFTTKGPAGGSGLGLATVHGIVGQAGGHVHVTSAPGEGATFSLLFPRIHETSSVSEINSPPEPVALARAGETVLLVEDEESVRQVTARMLRRLGYAVLTASDGAEGVHVARGHTGRLDALLSDLVMPVMGGVEAAARIVETRPGLPVVFLSGFSEDALTGRDALPEGGRLITKPFTMQQLATALRTALDSAAVKPPARSAHG